MDNNLKKFHNARFLEKISVVVLGLILLTSMVSLQSVTAGAAIDFDEEGNLSNSAGFSQSPQIAPSPDGAYVLWQDALKIFFGVISDSGASFSTGKDIGDSTSVVKPQLSVSGDNVYSVWNDGNDNVLFIPSSNKGVTHDPLDLLILSSAPSTAKSASPHTAASGSDVYVTWQEKISGNDEILFRASSNSGVTFGSIITVGTTESTGPQPQVASFGSNVYVVWSGKSGFLNAISFVSNDNNGNSADWSSAQDLAAGGNAKNPQVKASGNDVYV